VGRLRLAREVVAQDVWGESAPVGSQLFDDFRLLYSALLQIDHRFGVAISFGRFKTV
jgi:hypothetical protein